MAVVSEQNYNPANVAITGGKAALTGPFSISANVAVSGSTNLAQANSASYSVVSGSGTFTGTGSIAYQYLGVGDAAAANAGNLVFGSFVNMAVSGAYQGNRTALGAQLVISSAPAAGDTSLQAHVALYGRAVATANLGGSTGSITAGKGQIWGLNTNCQTTSLGTNLEAMFGAEIDMNNGAAIINKYGAAVIYQPSDTVAASYDDYGFLVTSSNTSPVSPAVMYAVGSLATYFPGTTSSTILGVVPQLYPSALSTPKFKYGVDLNPGGNTTITTGGFAFRSPGFTVDPLGNVAALGYTGTAGATISGAAISLNASSNFSVSIGTGSTTSAVSIGNSANTLGIAAPTTISTAGAASASPLLMSGAILTGGSGTTNFPAAFIQPTAATAATTWSTSGTALGVNAASGFAGNFLDFRVNGGASVFSVKPGGQVVAPPGTTASCSVQDSANAGTGIYFPASNQVAFCSNGTQCMTLVSTGFLQLGFGLQITGGGVGDFAAVFTSISASTYTLTAAWHTVNTNASTNASLTLTTPASPNNGQLCFFSTEGIITTLAFTGNAGATIGAGMPTTLAAGGSFGMMYQTSTTTWHRIQ